MSAAKQKVDPAVVSMYAAPQDEPFRVPAINVARIDPSLYRQEVAVPPGVPDKPNTIVVDVPNRFLYYVEDNGVAMRYGIGVGREGFAWSGEATVHDKTPWPKWFPPAEMTLRDEKARKYAKGMDGGPRNPLGARALYLWQGNKDTLFRIHGTAEPSSIGKAVSSGCIRLFNQDIIDLYNRVQIGTKVVVLGSPETPPLVDGVLPPPPPPMPPGSQQI
jgi:lipoprotein-anchoring transpeptidase ErfK/SrfK